MRKIKHTKYRYLNYAPEGTACDDDSYSWWPKKGVKRNKKLVAMRRRTRPILITRIMPYRRTGGRTLQRVRRTK